MVELKSKYEYNDSSIRYSTKRKKMKKSEMFKKDLLELFDKYGVFDMEQPTEEEVREILNDNNEFYMENVYNLLEGIG